MKSLILVAVTVFFSISVMAQNIPDWTKVSSTGDTVNLHSVLSANNAVVLLLFDIWSNTCDSAAAGMEIIWQDYGIGACDVQVYGLCVDTMQTDADINNFLANNNATYNAFKKCATEWFHFDTLLNFSGIPWMIIIDPDSANPVNSQVILTQVFYAPWVVTSMENALAQAGFNPCITNTTSTGWSDNNIVYPNPTTGVFTVTGTEPVEVFDLLGNQVLTDPKNRVIDLSNHPGGIYFVREGNTTTKLMLAK